MQGQGGILSELGDSKHLRTLERSAPAPGAHHHAQECPNGPIQEAATLGAVSSGAFGTHQRVTLTSVTQLPPSSCPLEEGPCEKGEVRRGDKRLQVPEQGTKNTHTHTLAWKIPWTEEPGGLHSMGLLRVGHD